MDESKRKRGPKPFRETTPELERKRRISVYVNDAEMKILEGFSAISKTSPPVYLRQAGLKTPPVVIPEINQDAWSKLAGAAANLNQIAKQLNVVRNADTSLSDLMKQVYEAGNKSFNDIANALEKKGVVVLSLNDAISLAEFRRCLVEARP